MSSPIKVAVIGGSIAGCTLANGMLNCPNIHFDVFDGKSTFRERGAGVALAPNAQNALRVMGIDVEAILARAGAMRMNATYCLVGVGSHKGKPLLKLPAGVFVVDRSHWLDALLEKIPEERLHASKKLAQVDQPGSTGSYTLHFEDGTTFEGYHVVIGSDGTKSKVREIILGPENQDKWAPRFGGYWDARGRMTPQDAAKQFGTELFDPRSVNEVGLVGPGAMLLFAPSDNGTVYHVVVSAMAGPGYDQTSWKTKLSREFLEESYQDWDQNFRDGMINALMAEESGPGVVFSQWESHEAPFYYRNPGLVMIGDAAHATVPWLGQGACIAIEDAAVLSSLLRVVGNQSQVGTALAVFDRVRRGRPEHVVRRSQEAAKLLTGQISMNPDDVKKIDPEVWWTDVWKIDMEGHVKDALQQFHDMKSS